MTNFFSWIKLTRCYNYDYKWPCDSIVTEFNSRTAKYHFASSLRHLDIRYNRNIHAYILYYVRNIILQIYVYSYWICKSSNYWRMNFIEIMQPDITGQNRQLDMTIWQLSQLFAIALFIPLNLIIDVTRRQRANNSTQQCFIFMYLWIFLFIFSTTCKFRRST